MGRLPVSRIWAWGLASLAATPPAFALGLFLAKVHTILLPLLPTLAVYPSFLLMVVKNRLREAVALVLAWALILTVLMAYATTAYGEGLGGLVIRGEAYRDEMFEWIRTGLGPEGDPRLFLVPKIKEIVIFSAAALATAGFAALLMGAVLLNYMNYYVGCLLLHAVPGAEIAVALLSWPIYAIIRVPGYVCLGTALSRLTVNLVRERRLKASEVKKLLYIAAVLIALDFLLKGTMANAFYQPMLKQLTRV